MPLIFCCHIMSQKCGVVCDNGPCVRTYDRFTLSACKEEKENMSITMKNTYNLSLSLAIMYLFSLFFGMTFSVPLG